MGSDPSGNTLTPDLLDVWTDPDTAMEIIGTSRGMIHSNGTSATKMLATDPALRATMLETLLALVDEGVLDKRPCGGDRFAFRWHAKTASSGIVTAPAPLTPTPAPPPTPTPVPAPAPTAPAAVPTTAPTDLAETAPALPSLPRSRPILQGALLVIPAVSCLLAVLIFLWFNHAVALVIAAVLAIIGIVGLVRRVPFAGAFTIGIVLGGLLVHLS